MIRSKIAPLFKRATTMTFFWAFLALALHVVPGALAPAHAQGTRKDDIVFNSRGVPLAGATVRVCAMPASGQPCTPLALIYSDVGLTQALANPTTTDGLGNYSFYAAPGKYEIEISGPGITTKQLPNVVLPNDPSSPTFSGAVSAFSLSLGGNLTVSGNTTVIGSLASGTLTLNNQGTPPGAPGAGTVDLYTKTTDKRLYYKDETGTEIGPLGPGTGAQTNVSNTFTATQNIAADFHTKGPNPFYDIMLFGGYEGSASTTGTMGASSPTLTLASAQDFANGQGILILGAGPATSLSTPTGVTVSQQNVTGSTSYSYCVVAEDYANGRTARSAAGSTSTGAANLGAFTAATITGCTRASGIVTCTTAAPHNLSPLSFIELSGTGSYNYNGTATLLTASGSTFTYPQQGQYDDPVGITAGTVKALALNVVQWNFTAYTVLRSYVYRCTTTCSLPANAANYTLAGVTQGMDGGFLDYGYAITASQIGNGDVSATAPTTATTQWLPTTIVGGGGTTTLTLAASSTTAVSGVTVKHDNAPIFPIVCAAMSQPSGGGIIFIPNENSTFPINSTLNFGTACPLGTSAYSLEIDVASNIGAAASVIPRGVMKFKGLTTQGHITNFYNMAPTTSWGGSAYPFIYALPGTSSNWSMENFIFQAFRPYEADIVQDQDSNGQNVTQISYTNVHTNANLSPSYILGGGFGFFWSYGGWSMGGATSFAAPPAVWAKADYGLNLGSNSQLPGIFYTNHTYMFGGFLFDGAGQGALTSQGVKVNLRDMLAESSYGPMFRFRIGGNPFSGELDDILYADFLGGTATPVIDAVNTQIVGLKVLHPGCSDGQQPVFQAGTAATSYTNVTIDPIYAGCSLWGLPDYTLGSTFVNTAALTSGTSGQFAYQMATPAAPATAVSSGGSVPPGTYSYAISAVDANGNQTQVSAPATTIVTSGNQTVTITPTLPIGAVGYYAYRASVGGYAQVVTSSCVYVKSNTSLVDNTPSSCGNINTFALGLAGLATLSSQGVSSYQVKLANGFADTILPASLTANRSQTLPDVTGIVPVTSYLNSAYDNATRANGAIGSNWTVAQNGFNIASNQIQGTAAASNSAFWNANAFSNLQFAQATITALNGTTDFPGVSVLNSGTGSSSTFYGCLENSTNIYIQRVVNASATNLTSAASTGAVGDLLRLEVAPGGVLTCYKNGAVALTFTDTQITAGSPGLTISGNVATLKNWSGGNLHPLGHLDVEQDWTKTQHWLANGGACTMSSGTTCTVTLSEQPSTPDLTHCLAQVQGGTPIAGACSISGTTATVTAASSNSATWAVFIF
ncbi:MAG: hypothetical protein WB994_20580 [Candidatus Acidiferrum sp.]